MRPRIGVTVNDEEKGYNKRGIFIGGDYTDGVYAAGGLPVVLPFTTDDEILAAWVDTLDGLLLSGGDDIAPSLYGEEPRPGLGEISPVRDMMEAKLLRLFVEKNKPVLGICRGVQVMNAVLGGTLYQDLPKEWKANLQHAQRAPRDYMAHVVDVKVGSLLHKIVGEKELPVNTFHHQAVRGIAPGFVAVAHSRDGLVEAIEHTKAEFLLGVQWHPENLWRSNEAHRRLFRHFVEAAAQGKG